MREATPESNAREGRRGIVLLLVLLLPLALVVLFTYVGWPGSRDRASERTPEIPNATTSESRSTDRRLVVVIIDSLRRQAVDELMPNLKALAHQRDAVDLDVHTARGNMSLTCIQTLLEGRESPYVSGIHNFTAPGRSLNNSLPAAAAHAGFKPALIGDFIICGLYGPYASVSINVISWNISYLARDLTGIDEAVELLRDKKTRVIILHTPGTDKAAHEWHPGHPEYSRHFREVDAKLAELFAQLDLNNDYLIVTGDHGHDDIGSHVPRSVAIFAGGLFPELFTALGPLGELQQIDMLFFMAFAQNLPLPIQYEGRYFGFETPIDLPAATPALQQRLEVFGSIQRNTLSAAGFDAPNLTDAIAAKRAQVSSADEIAYKRILPLLVFYVGWVLLAFHINDRARARVWPLAATAAAAPVLWIFASPSIGMELAIVIAVAVFIFAARAGELRRLCFLCVLVIGAAFTAYDAENWRNIFANRALLFVGGLVGAGALLMMIRGGVMDAWPAALGAVCLFVLPSGVYEPQFGPNILRGLVFPRKNGQ